MRSDDALEPCACSALRRAARAATAAYDAALRPAEPRWRAAQDGIRARVDPRAARALADALSAPEPRQTHQTPSTGART